MFTITFRWPWRNNGNVAFITEWTPLTLILKVEVRSLLANAGGQLAVTTIDENI